MTYHTVKWIYFANFNLNAVSMYHTCTGFNFHYLLVTKIAFIGFVVFKPHLANSGRFKKNEKKK